MSRIDITSSGGATLPDGMLQTANPLDTTLQVVTDNVGNSSTLLLSTDTAQINSTLHIHTDNAEILDIEDVGSNNRFNINRSGQNINLDFASKPTDTTTQVGAIRTAIDGTNLADVIKFQENGQVTITERLKLESDSTVTTQTSSVIQATTTNASLVLAPNGTGAIVAAIPDGTATGGNARGQYAVDLQMSRNTAAKISSGNNSGILSGYSNTASGFNSAVFGGNNNNASGAGAMTAGQDNTASAELVIVFGRGNTASSNNSTVSGGQSNTASTGTHATVVGGQSNTASGQYSVSGGFSNTASGVGSVAFGRNNTASNQYAVALGGYSQASATYSTAVNGGRSSATFSFSSGDYSYSYLLGQSSFCSGSFYTQLGDAQQSLLTASKQSSLTTGATTVLSLDGTGTTNLIIPNGNNRAWNVQVNWVAVVTAITGTATGISVGDVVTSVDLLGFKRVGGTSSASVHTSAATKLMVTTPAQYAACAIAYSAGASQEMALTFTGPTFVGGGSVTMRVVARIELSEVAW